MGFRDWREAEQKVIEIVEVIAAIRSVGKLRGLATRHHTEEPMANNRGFLKQQPTQRNVKGSGNATIDDAKIARVAYDLYEQRGREDGHALDDWLKAETIVRK